MEIKKLDYDFSVCKVENYSEVNFDSEYYFTGKTTVLPDAGYEIIWFANV